MTYDKENYILHCGEQVKEMGMLVSGGYWKFFHFITSVVFPTDYLLLL